MIYANDLTETQTFVGNQVWLWPQEIDCVYLSSMGVAAKFRTITVTALQRLPNIATATAPRITVVPGITICSRISDDALRNIWLDGQLI